MLKLLHPYEQPVLPGWIETPLSLGFLGVDIFFVISGIVIGRSALGRTWSDFAKARFLRLFPAYFVATVLAIVLAPYTLSTYPTFDQTWISVTGLQWFFGGPTIVGPAWTLFIEITFYILVGGAIACCGVLNASRLRGLAKIWLVILLLAPSLQLPWLNFLFVAEYGGISAWVWSSACARTGGRCAPRCRQSS